MNPTCQVCERRHFRTSVYGRMVVCAGCAIGYVATAIAGFGRFLEERVS